MSSEGSEEKRIVETPEVPADETAISTEAERQKPSESIFALTVKFPREPHETQIHVSTHDQIQDLRQAISDSAFAAQYSCFHLEHEGKRINDFLDLSEVKGVVQNPVIHLVEDPYTEKEARLHVLRIRELVGLATPKMDASRGLDAGASVFDSVLASENPESVSHGNAAFNQHLLNLKSMADYKFNSTGDTNAILAPGQPSAPKPVRSIALSHWNPPPNNLSMKGHLLYLVISINEGEQYHVTSHVSGFYVNKSSNHKFDPSPRTAPKDCFAHSLLNLISQLSPSFDQTFEELQEFSKNREPLSLFPLTHAIPHSPWLVPASSVTLSSHQPDAIRPQESLLTSSIEGNENLRDWNEEFQSTRELPRETVQDRIFRERLTAMLSADYVDCAVRGAVLLARGELTPLNPTEPVDAQIFVWNNIFFSYGADGVGTFAAEGGDEAARVATGKDVVGVRAVNQLDISGLFTAGTVVVDYMGKRIVGQSIVPGIFKQRDPGEHQIDYGGVEGKDIVATNSAFESLFKQLSRSTFVKSHPVWDKEKKRHDLQASIETKGLIGTDGRKYVLDLYRITPLDIAWLENHWEEAKTDEEGNSLPKSPSKNYPHRMTVLRLELIDSLYRRKATEFLRDWKAKNSAQTNGKEPANEKPEDRSERRPEAGLGKKSNDESVNEKGGKLQSSSAHEQEQTSGINHEETVEEPSFTFELNPDVFSGQEPQTIEEREQMAKDESDVREACAFLTDEEIPRLIKEYSETDSAFPVDGISLTHTFHRRGINMRYLGHVAGLAKAANTPRTEVIYKLTVQEMVSRAFKHIAARYLKSIPTPLAPSCIAHLLNCLLGADANPSPKPEVDDGLRSLYTSAELTFEAVSVESLRADLISEIALRYRYTYDGPLVLPGRHLPLLREVCIKLGLQLSARDYAFTSEALQVQAEKSAKKQQKSQPSVNGKSNGHLAGKKKKGGNQQQHQQQPRSSSPVSCASLPVQTFHADDVLNFVPVVKTAAPKSMLAEEAFEAGRISIQQNDKELGSELLFESLSLYEQIYGILHPECARMYLQLSNIYHTLNENAGAVELARKAVIIFERTLGVDCVETIQAYMNLSLHEHGQGHPERALIFTLHALELWKLVFGLDHPDAITAISNSAIMLQAQRLYHESRVWFEEALKMSLYMFEANSLASGTLMYQLSQALAFDKDPHAAVNKMREAHRVFKELFGEDDSRTKDSEAWLQQLTQAAVKSAKSARLLQDAVAMQRMRGMAMNPKSVGVESVSNTAPGSQIGSNKAKGDGRRIDELVRYIEGDSKMTTQTKNSQNPKLRGRKTRA